MWTCRLAVVSSLWLGIVSSPLLAQEAVFGYRPLEAATIGVPQTLLGLVHAPEVQAELQLPKPSLEEFLPTLREIDGPWWRSRIKPEKEQREIIANQELLLAREFELQFGKRALTRLRQMELQSQGYRMLLRPEIARYIGVTSRQKDQLIKLFTATDAFAAKGNDPAVRSDPAFLKKLEQTKKDEYIDANAVLTDDQKAKLKKILGERFDASKLERIFPLAPKLIDTGHWIGEKRVADEDLRGQVVLVHFYAFQCHNCHANFPIYNRWHNQLVDKGVRLVGIQTPETQAERDVEAVTNAARKEGFRFPVIIDLKNENWDAWANTMWPTVYVVDKKGYIRLWWQGELKWQGAKGDETIEKMVDKLLAE